MSALAWSGLAAGLSMGFSFLCLSLLQAGLPPAPWRHLIASAGYSIGFLIVVLGRQQLFTESTLTAVLPLLTRRDRATLFSVLRLWAIVLAANLAGAAAIAALVTPSGIFPPDMRAAMVQVAAGSFEGGAGSMILRSVLAGWLIALMVWLLPSARSARMFVILLLTYVVALGRFSHVIAGSVEALFGVFTGHASFGDYLVRFFLPTLLGNTIGGVALVAMLNHAPLAGEFQGANLLRGED